MPLWVIRVASMRPQRLRHVRYASDSNPIGARQRTVAMWKSGWLIRSPDLRLSMGATLLHRPLGGFGLSFHAVEATCPSMSAIAPIATGSPRSRNMTRSANIRHRASVLMLVQRSVAYLSLLSVATRRPGWFRCLASHSARAPADGSTGLANGGSGHASASDHCPTYAASEANLRDHAVRLRSRRRRYCVRRSCDG
jgi:hypothetical protein